jgi:predicted MFS family arabinose efflux permease
MTLLAGATGVGYAAGASIAGHLADDHGHTAAFAVTVSAAGLAVLLALTANKSLREARPVSA